MTKYAYVRTSREIPDPAQALGSLNLRDVFTAAGYELAGDGSVLTITHLESGRAVDVPFGVVLGAVRAELPAAEPAPKARKKGGANGQA